jgi:hypothetical protein
MPGDGTFLVRKDHFNVFLVPVRITIANFIKTTEGTGVGNILTGLVHFCELIRIRPGLIRFL